MAIITLSGNALLFLFTTNSVGRPSTWYVALFTAHPGNLGYANNELSGTGYSRQQTSFSVTNGSYYSTANQIGQVTFQNTGSSNWASVTHVGIVGSDGWVYSVYQLPSSVTVSPGSSLVVKNYQIRLE